MSMMTSSRLLTEHRVQDNAECLFIEINIRNKAWFLCCSYNSRKNHMSHLSKVLDNYYKSLWYFISGSFNSQPSKNCLNDICNLCNLSNLVKKLKCFKIPDNPSSINLFLTSRRKCFRSTITMKTGILIETKCWLQF